MYDIDNCAVPSQQKIVKDTANAVDKIEQNNMQRWKRLNNRSNNNNHNNENNRNKCLKRNMNCSIYNNSKKNFQQRYYSKENMPIQEQTTKKTPSSSKNSYCMLLDESSSSSDDDDDEESDVEMEVTPYVDPWSKLSENEFMLIMMYINPADCLTIACTSKAGNILVKYGNNI